MVYNFLSICSIILPKIYRNKKLYFIVMYGLLAVVAGFRGASVGTDTASYAYDYYDGKNLSIDDVVMVESTRLERGVLLVMKLACVLWDSPITFNCLMSFFTFFLVGFFVYNNIKQYELATFIIVSFGFFFYMMNAERQALSIAVCVNSYPYIIRNEKCKAILILCIASLFHNSIWIMLPIMLTYWLLSKKRFAYKRNCLKLFVLSVLTVGVLYCGYEYITNNLELLNGVYVGYFSYFSNFNSPAMVGEFLMFQGVLFFIIAIFINSFRLSEDDAKENFFIGQMLVIACVMLVAEVTVMRIFYRFVDTFAFPLCMGIPKVLDLIASGTGKTIIKYCIYVLGLLYMNYMMYSGIQGIWPYEIGL